MQPPQIRVICKTMQVSSDKVSLDTPVQLHQVIAGL